jgi:hypothetical protein
MERAAIFLIALIVTGCATPHSAVKPSPDGPAVIYAIPQSQAFAIAGGAIRAAAPRCGSRLPTHRQNKPRGRASRL